MRLVWFLLSSILEWTAIFALTFSLFMFKIRDNIVHIIFSAALLAMFSYILRDVANMALISPFLQMIIVFLIIWLMVRVPPIYAGIMAAFGYICYGFVQTVLLMTLHWTAILPLEKVFSSHLLQYLAAFISSSLTFIIASLLIRYRVGFSFVPDTSASIGLRGNIQFLILIILAAFTNAIYLFSFKHGFLQWVFWGMTIIIGVLLFYLFRKESTQ
jgi:hypothetical protein